jgi:hypothetical protein
VLPQRARRLDDELVSRLSAHEPESVIEALGGIFAGQVKS